MIRGYLNRLWLHNLRDSSCQWLPNDCILRISDVRSVYFAAIDERELVYARGGQEDGG